MTKKLNQTRKDQIKNLSNYLSSPKAAWYWLTLLLSISTIITIILIPENNSPLIYLRPSLGTIFLLFLPGFAFIKALFPKEVPIKTSSENMAKIERFALSLGMSLILVPIVGLILNYTPWGIQLIPVLLSLLALTITFATIAIIAESKSNITDAK